MSSALQDAGKVRGGECMHLMFAAGITLLLLVVNLKVIGLPPIVQIYSSLLYLYTSTYLLITSVLLSYISFSVKLFMIK